MFKNLTDCDKNWIKDDNPPKRIDTSKKPEITVIQPKEFDTSNFNVLEFREMADVWTTEQLELFVQDKRQTIRNEAKKLLTK